MTNEINIFLQAIADWNGSGDLSDIDFTAGDVVKTHEPRSAFISDAGATKYNGLFVREEFQIGKGLRRGNLFAMQFHGFCLVVTSAEGVIAA